MTLSRLADAKALRDIFNSTDTASLWAAFGAISSETSSSAMSLEAEFNRFFVGPDAPLAPPYASIYLEKSGLLMSKTTQEVRGLYTLFGLKNPKDGQQPDDFLGFELDAYYQLLYIELHSNILYLKPLRCYFLQEHMARWILPFVEAVKQHAPSPALTQIVDLLQRFITTELSIQGENHEYSPITC
ncbi:molecular chaperone TorD family protein [Sulfurospirillum sp. T05]|uniref:Molecular chaperone TorD family protein n=1 Tax=Sulfurospirillum tamanense TaxID=2813362 RepID=A0ABS2WPW6_9BACT|nr:molecular chaperone TorD family protein [Sulfurospirillum tamanensis]MBN2963555.1 molecular chaperone TorD family protein [Sulfurospirillum tamanensis]